MTVMSGSQVTTSQEGVWLVLSRKYEWLRWRWGTVCRIRWTSELLLNKSFVEVDPNVDPELAMAIRMSLEEERARHANQGAATGHALEDFVRSKSHQ